MLLSPLSYLSENSVAFFSPQMIVFFTNKGTRLCGIYIRKFVYILK